MARGRAREGACVTNVTRPAIQHRATVCAPKAGARAGCAPVNLQRKEANDAVPADRCIAPLESKNTYLSLNVKRKCALTSSSQDGGVVCMLFL